MFELFQPTHLLFVFLVALVVFGPKRLIEMSRSLGQTIQSIQDYKDELINYEEEPKYELTGTSTENESEKESPPPTEKKGWVCMFTGLESPVHLLILLAIILLLFGGKRLPEMGWSLGQGIREFKEGLNSKEEREKTEGKSPEAIEEETEKAKM